MIRNEDTQWDAMFGPEPAAPAPTINAAESAILQIGTDESDPFIADFLGNTTAPEPVAPTQDVSQPEEIQKQYFGEAFATARKAGAKVFEWGGKPYTTGLAEDAHVGAEPKPTATAWEPVSDPGADGAKYGSRLSDYEGKKHADGQRRMGSLGLSTVFGGDQEKIKSINLSASQSDLDYLTRSRIEGRAEPKIAPKQLRKQRVENYIRAGSSQMAAEQAAGFDERLEDKFRRGDIAPTVRGDVSAVGNSENQAWRDAFVPEPERDSALASSADQAQKLVGHAYQALGGLVGWESLEDAGEAFVKKQDADLKEGGYRPDTRSFTESYQQDGFLGALGWTGTKMQENAASSGVTLAGAALAALAAPFSLPAAAAIGGSTIAAGGMLGIGEAKQEMVEKGIKGNDAVAVGSGVLIAILDRFGASKAIPQDVLMRATGSQVVTALIDKGYIGAAKAIAKEIGKRTIPEAITEPAQELIAMGAAGALGGKYTADEIIDRVIDTAVVGAAFGGTASTAGVASEIATGPKTKDALIADQIQQRVSGTEFAALPDAGIGQNGPSQEDYETAARRIFGGGPVQKLPTAPPVAADTIEPAPANAGVVASAPVIPPPSGPITAALQAMAPVNREPSVDVAQDDSWLLDEQQAQDEVVATPEPTGPDDGFMAAFGADEGSVNAGGETAQETAQTIDATGLDAGGELQETTPATPLQESANMPVTIPVAEQETQVDAPQADLTLADATQQPSAQAVTEAPQDEARQEGATDAQIAISQALSDAETAPIVDSQPAPAIVADVPGADEVSGSTAPIGKEVARYSTIAPGSTTGRGVIKIVETQRRINELNKNTDGVVYDYEARNDGRFDIVGREQAIQKELVPSEVRPSAQVADQASPAPDAIQGASGVPVQTSVTNPVLPGDVTAQSGAPFSSRGSAALQARRYPGHVVVEVNGGFVLRTGLDAAAHEAATSPANDTPQPSDAQKKAGNYKVGRVSIHGLDISIENPKGSVRSGVDSDGERWETTMQSHYGYLRGTVGRDKDHVDVFLADGAEQADTAWVIDQINQDGSFDEHKIVIGPGTEDAARAAYLANYDAGWTGLGAITSMLMADFKAWVFDQKKTKKPVSYRQPTQSRRAAKPSNNLIARIKQLGGINVRYRSDVLSDNRGGPVGLFSNTGKGLDDLATELHAEGFAINADDVDGGVGSLTDLIQEAVAGRTVLNFRGQEDARIADQQAEQRAALIEEIRTLGVDVAANAPTARLEELRAKLQQEVGAQGQSDADRLGEAVSGDFSAEEWAMLMDAPGADLFLLETDLAITQYQQQEREDADAVEARYREEGQGDTGQAPARDAPEDRAVGGAEQGNRAPQESREELSLTGQTPEQIRAEEEAIEVARRAAEAEARKAEDEARRLRIKKEDEDRKAFVMAEREAEKKAEIDAAVDSFELGQEPPKPVEKKVSQDQLAGQKDIFGSPAPAQPPSSLQTTTPKIAATPASEMSEAALERIANSSIPASSVAKDELDTRAKNGKPLDKIMVDVTVIEAETGEKITIQEPADQALADIDSRIDLVNRLAECLAS